MINLIQLLAASFVLAALIYYGFRAMVWGFSKAFPNGIPGISPKESVPAKSAEKPKRKPRTKIVKENSVLSPAVKKPRTKKKDK